MYNPSNFSRKQIMATPTSVASTVGRGSKVNAMQNISGTSQSVLLPKPFAGCGKIILRITCGLLLAGVCFCSVEARSKSADQASLHKRTSRQAMFYFRIDKLEPLDDFGVVDVEGTTLTGWRYSLECRPPQPVYGPTFEPMPQALIDQQFDTHFAVASPPVMTIYRGQSGSRRNNVIAVCEIFTRIPHATLILEAQLESSRFRRWGDAVGYEVELRLYDELLTAACTQTQRTKPCVSLPPQRYRVTRTESEVRVYDELLNLKGIYSRILAERSTIDQRFGQ